MAGVLRIQHTSVPMPAGGQTAAREFYGDVLGMEEIVPPSTLDRTRLAWFRAGDGGHEVHVFTEETLGPNSTGQHLCLQVDDIAAFRARLNERGVAIQETIQIHNRPRFFVRDPFGNLVELTQITGDYQ